MRRRSCASSRAEGEGWLERTDGARLFYRVDDFTDPWIEPETPAAHAWWTRMMGETLASTQAGFPRRLHTFDATQELEHCWRPIGADAPGKRPGQV